MQSAKTAEALGGDALDQASSDGPTEHDSNPDLDVRAEEPSIDHIVAEFASVPPPAFTGGWPFFREEFRRSPAYQFLGRHKWHLAILIVLCVVVGIVLARHGYGKQVGFAMCAFGGGTLGVVFIHMVWFWLDRQRLCQQTERLTGVIRRLDGLRNDTQRSLETAHSAHTTVEEENERLQAALTIAQAASVLDDQSAWWTGFVDEDGNPVTSKGATTTLTLAIGNDCRLLAVRIPKEDEKPSLRLNRELGVQISFTRLPTGHVHVKLQDLAIEEGQPGHEIECQHRVVLGAVLMLPSNQRLAAIVRSNPLLAFTDYASVDWLVNGMAGADGPRGALGRRAGYFDTHQRRAAAERARLRSTGAFPVAGSLSFPPGGQQSGSGTSQPPGPAK